MPESDAPFRLRLIGEAVGLHGDGRTLVLERKDALMLAYLAIEGPTPRGTLATLLWPDVDDERARSNLRQRLFRLRKSLGFELLEGAVVAGLRADVAIDLGSADPGAGELLSGVTEADASGLAPWLAAAREHRRAGCIEALARQASLQEGEGQLALALATAQQLVDLDATSEHAHRRVMRLHYLRGDRAAALAAFDHCCDVLERVLGVAPEAETEALRARIEASPPPAPEHARRPLPVSVLRPPVLIGRAPEWAALAANWAMGAATALSGEAGMGKTRLTRDFAQAHPGVLLLDARPGDLRVPHALLARLLRQLSERSGGRLPPDVAGALVPELDPARFVGGVEALVRQAHADGLAGVIVDDLQYADAASLDVLRHLVAASIPLRWIVTLRPVELGPEAQSFHDELLASASAQSLALQALDEAQIALLIDTLALADLDGAKLAPALARHSGGNPLYLLETLKLMLVPGAPLPGSPGAVVAAQLPRAGNVTRLIGQRIARLSGPAIKLARCAAIAGADFSSELAAHVLGVRALDLADAWTELEAAQLLRDSAFTHDLVAEAARDSVPAPIARQLHAEMAAFLEARQAEPARVAQHWLDADDEARALPSLLAAADRAAAAWRSAEEGRLLRRAAQIAARVGAEPAVAFAMLLRANEACERSDVGGADHIAVLEALDAAAHENSSIAAARLARSSMQAHRGDGAASEAMARAGLQAIGDEPELGADALRVDLAAALANALMLQERPAEAVDVLRDVEPRLIALADRQRQVNHYATLGVAFDVAGRLAQAEQAHRHALALARAQQDRPSELTILNNLAVSLAESGRFTAALEQLQDAYRLRESAPELLTAALHLEMSLGDVLRCVGEFRESLAWLERALPIIGEHAPRLTPAVHNQQALTWLHLGQHARAWQLLQQALAGGDTLPAVHAKSHLLLARCALAQGQHGVAVDALGAARSLLTASARFAAYAQAELLATRFAEPDAAYRAATAVVMQAGKRQMQGVRMAGLACAARCALACGHTTVAVGHAAEALALWPEHLPDDFYIGEVWLAAADAFHAARDTRLVDVLRHASVWISGTAQGRVPEEFRDSFLNRNPFNRELIAMAGRNGVMSAS
jgi:DNA-binding SARP family transcriptional activator/tetratricopeptide (TPR) repeat protein